MKLLSRTVVIFSISALMALGALAQTDTSAGSTDTSTDQSMSQSNAQTSAGQAMNLNSSDIRQVQSKLKDKGYKVGKADGIMGPKTQAALRKFQHDQGQPVTGTADTQTLAALGLQNMAGKQAAGEAAEEAKEKTNEQAGKVVEKQPSSKSEQPGQAGMSTPTGRPSEAPGMAGSSDSNVQSGQSSSSDQSSQSSDTNPQSDSSSDSSSS